MDNLIKDIRYGIRSLLKRPGFAAIAILTLALGIGANTAIFSVVNAVLLRPLPFADPDRLVMIWEDASFAGFARNTPAPANYVDVKNQNQVFSDMAAMDMRTFNLTGDGQPEKIEARGVTASFFPLLGVKPALGRWFVADEDKPGANRVAMITHSLWQQRYGGEANIIGRELSLNGEKYTVVGVMPAGFQFLDKNIGIWVPIAFTSEMLANRGRHYLIVVGRMKPGVTFAQADAEVRTIHQRIAHDNPETGNRVAGYALPLRDQVSGDLRRPLFVLLVAVGFVLLIACANIANLLLSRAASRRREMAVRAALGAGRMRLMRQLLIESLLLAIVGCVCGLLLASWSFAFLQRLIPDSLAASTSLGLDLPVLGFTVLVTLLTAVLFGLAPAFQASRIDLNEALKQGGGRSGLNAGGNRLRSAMVVAEVALALVLLVGAGLLIQTFLKLRDQYSGLQAENVLTMRTVLSKSKYPEHPQRVSFYKQVLERVQALPGVVSAGYATTVPLAVKGGTNGFAIEGRTVEQLTSGGLAYDANHRQVSADYLKTIGIPIQQGRGFTEADNEQSIPVGIINDTMARQYWPGENPLGKRIKLGDPGDTEIPWVTIVGVAGDVRQMGVDEPVKPEMYFPYQQGIEPFYAPRDLVIRTSVDPLSLVAAASNEIHQVDPDQPISNVRTMDQVLGEETASRRLGMTLLTIFAGLALLLATLGIYGVLAYFVVQHTQEIGVRMALGAQRRNILTLVLKKGMGLTLVGVAIGLGAAFTLTRLMASLLFGIGSTDPLTYAAIAVLLTFVALIACYVPARRATKVDPMTALIYE
ncbi:MAG: putative transport system permease protein [Blastocatellia bacterium]|jgi:putative ABC transport system permease protein|nr:putative transport system permease protein [Blastocatellia bacterium]